MCIATEANEQVNSTIESPRPSQVSYGVYFVILSLAPLWAISWYRVIVTHDMMVSNYTKVHEWISKHLLSEIGHCNELLLENGVW